MNRGNLDDIGPVIDQCPYCKNQQDNRLLRNLLSLCSKCRRTWL